MAFPHQVGLTITYDGTIQEKVTETVSSKSSDSSYTVVAGDTLWGISKEYYKAGKKYTVIYNANKEVIESTAKAHGKSSSSNGHWIWPGTVLTIPGAASSQATSKTVTKVTGIATPKLGNKMAKQTKSFSYTDVASGQSDSMSITLSDLEKEWMGSLMPKRGANLGAKLTLTNWNKEESVENFECGSFILDDISFSGRPLGCVLGGVSVPAMDDFKSLPKTKTWEKTTVRDIASEITKNAGVTLYYDADEIQIAEIEQNKQTDSTFLYSICEKYGLAMKVYNHKIVIFDIIKYEANDSVATINESQMLSWSYNTTIEGTYTGVNLSYTDPDSEETIDVTLGNGGRMYELNTQASGRYDAELQAAAKVNAANRQIETMQITIRADISIVASHCIAINGLEKIDGKYYVDKIKHSIGNGYTMQLTLHRVQTPIKAAQSTTTLGGKTYTVVSGDTLWGISKKYYKAGKKYTVIYNANKEVIESTAKAHGKSSSDNGHWIWPGTVLTIPEV